METPAGRDFTNLSVILSDGRPIYQGAPLVPAPNSRGTIPVIVSLPINHLGPGNYEVWAIAQQGERIVDEFTSFELRP